MEKQIALITGGTSGIGLATAQQFLQANWQVILVGRHRDKYIEAKKVLKPYISTSEDCSFIAGDVGKVQDIEIIMDEVTASYGKLDALINNAGIYYEGAITEITEEIFDKVINTNLKSAYFMSKYAIPLLRKGEQASIVNVSSDAGINGNYFCTTYCASKGGMTIFSKALALELAMDNIRVNCICPGDVDTPLTRSQFGEDEESIATEMASTAALYPLGRIAQPEEIASIIKFLASKEASFVTGAVWSADGGLTAV